MSIIKSDLDTEFRVLRTLCRGTNEVTAKLLPKLTASHFSSSTTQALFRRISYVLRDKGYIPTWQDLAADPGVRVEARKAMRSVTVKSARTETEANSSFDVLDTHRKVRELFQLGSNLETALSQPSIDLTATLEGLSHDLHVVIDGSGESTLTHIGEGSNSLAMVKRLLKGGGPTRIPTGFHAFDKHNVGFPIGAFVLLGANTGSGKSLLVSAMSDNMAMFGASVAVVPLEMNAEENMQRNLARIADEDLNNFLNPVDRMSEQRRKEIYRTYKAYDERLASLGGRITIVEPKFDTTIENLLEFLKPMQYDVIFIDYVGLLSGMNEDNQWLALSKAAAYAKRWAELNSCVVIGAVQVTADGVVRYSRGMVEAASFAWLWTFSDEQRKLGITEVQQAKARQGRMFPFKLKFDWAKMTVRDTTADEEKEYDEASARGGKGGGTDGDNKARWKKSRKSTQQQEYDDYVEAEEDKGSPRSNVKGGRTKKNQKPSDFEY